METIYSYFEGAIGLGLILGPQLGSIFYNLYGFGPSFYIISIIYILALMQSILIIPNSLNRSFAKEDTDDPESQEEYRE